MHSIFHVEGHVMAQLVEALRYKAVVLIPNGFIAIFHWCNPSSHTVALGLTQPLTKMSTRNISWGVKVIDAYSWQPYHLHVLMVMKSENLNLLEPSGPVQASTADASVLPFISHVAATCFSVIVLPYSMRWHQNLFKEWHDNNAKICRSYMKIICMNYRIVHLLVLPEFFYFINVKKKTLLMCWV